MSLLLIDGFDHRGTNDLVDKWGTHSVASTGSGYSRWASGQGILLGTINWINTHDFGNQATLCVGFAMKIPISGSFADTYKLISFKDDTTEQVYITANASGQIQAYRAGTPTLLGTSTNNLTSYKDKWCYVEVKVVINNSTGSVEVKINESSTNWLNLTSQDTQNTANAYANNLRWGSLHSGSNHFDDFYLDDTDFLGECRVKTFYPDSVSSSINDFTASAGNKDDCVDEENAPNDDTDYVYSTTVNHQQGFGITTGSLSTVKGIQLNNCIKKADIGTVKIKNLVRSNSVNYLETNEYELTTDYTFNSVIWDDDPDDSNPWDQTKLEAAEFGLEITTYP